MYIVNIFKRHYDEEEYSSLVNIEPCVPVKCETNEEAEKFLERIGFDNLNNLSQNYGLRIMI